MADSLARLLARLPRVGEVTAARLAAAIGAQPEDYRRALACAVEQEAQVLRCSICGDDVDGPTCGCERGPAETILVVTTPAARRSITRAWPGRYHVLGGLGLAAVPGTRALLERCRDGQVRDVVLALGGSPEARETDATLARVLGPVGPTGGPSSLRAWRPSDSTTAGSG